LNSPDDEVARIEKVTVEDVNRVAKKYLDLDRAITAVLTPQESGKAVTSKSFGGQEKISLGEAKPTALPKWAASALNRLTVPDSKIHPTVMKLDNGITLLVQPATVSDIVGVYGMIKSRPELSAPAGKEGVARVLDELFGYGTEKLDRLAFEAALDEIGAELTPGNNFSLLVTRDTFDRGVEILADSVIHPRLPADAFAIVKEQTAQALGGELKSPSYVAHRALRASLFPKDDPAQREATPTTVGAVTLDDVRAYHRAAYRPDITTIAVIGNVSPEQARAVIDKHFGQWKADGPPPATELPPVPPSKPAIVSVPDGSRVQEEVLLAETLALTRANSDYYPLTLGNNILSGSFYSTRFTRDLRKNAGLVYYVGSGFEVGKTRGVYTVQYACDPQNVSKVHRIVIRELEDMRTRPVTAEELARAKQFLLRQIPLGESDVNRIARGLLERTRLDLSLDEPTLAARRYLEMEAKDIQAAFAKWLRPSDLARVSQGPAPR
jgi:zinc protease